MTTLPLVLHIRDKLLAKYPAEFRHGYLSAYTGENQLPCDAAGYMIGHHTCVPVRNDTAESGLRDRFKAARALVSPRP